MPTEVASRFSTIDDWQTGLTVVCYENVVPRKGRVDLKACTEIGRTVLPFARPLPVDSPAEFRFSLSADGLLSVHAKDLTTGGEVDLEIQTAAILTVDEVEEGKRRNRNTTVS